MAGALQAVNFLKLVCTTFVRPDSARAFIVFAGDAGCLVLGALLIATLYAPAGSVLRRGALPAPHRLLNG